MEHQNNFNYLNINEITDINGGYNRALNPFGSWILVDPPIPTLLGISLLKRR